MRADICVGLVCPNHRRGDGVLNVEAGKPLVAQRCELARADIADEAVGPEGSVVVRHAVDAAEELCRDARVPDMVQVELGAFKKHVNAVATPGDVLCVQRLVNVAEEVHDELCGLVAPPQRKRRVE